MRIGWAEKRSLIRVQRCLFACFGLTREPVSLGMRFETRLSITMRIESYTQLISHAKGPRGNRVTLAERMLPC